MKNAIIGFAFNYSTEDIAPFLNSLDSTGFNGDLLLYINNQSNIKEGSYGYVLILKNFEKDHKYSIKKHRILRVIRKVYKKYFKSSHALKALKTVQQSSLFTKDMLSYFYVNYYLATMRFVLYYNLLLSNRYENVFFSDVSDVIFQENIFNYIVPNKVLAFEEKKDILLGQDYFNKLWVINACGEEAFEKIKSNSIYCSGTILSDYNTSITFLKDYIQLILSKEFKKNSEGLDQAFYNYMISYYQLPYFQKSENGKIIFTTALNSADDFIINKNKISYKGMPATAPSVIHQYTRHPEILSWIKKTYAYRKI